jgi:hypothetical protein
MKNFTVLKCSIFALLVSLCALSNQSKGQSNTPSNQDVSVKGESYEYAYSICKEEMAAMEADRVFERGYAYKKKASLNEKSKASGRSLDGGSSCATTIDKLVTTQKYMALLRVVRASVTPKRRFWKI